MIRAVADASKAQTISLSMTAAEVSEVRFALALYVTDLRSEISHTERYELREALKTQRIVLEGVLRRLGGRPAAGQGETR